jgi:dGTPase
LTVRDLVRTCDTKLAAGEATLSHSAAFKSHLAELHRFLRERFYKSPRVLERMTAGRTMIERLFERYVRDPGALPEHSRARVAVEGVHRVVCDYVAGMTDRYARRLAGAEE